MFNICFSEDIPRYKDMWDFVCSQRPWSPGFRLSTCFQILSPTVYQTDFFISCSIFTSYGEPTLGHKMYAQNIKEPLRHRQKIRHLSKAEQPWCWAFRLHACLFSTYKRPSPSTHPVYSQMYSYLPSNICSVGTSHIFFFSCFWLIVFCSSLFCYLHFLVCLSSRQTNSF